MEITMEMKRKLAGLIVEEIRKEFQHVYLSKNLLNSIYIYQMSDKVIIDIDPKKYYISLYQQKGILKFIDNKSSYASEIDKTGGISGKHKDYVNECINIGIQKWIKLYNIDAKTG